MNNKNTNNQLKYLFLILMIIAYIGTLYYFYLDLEKYFFHFWFCHVMSIVWAFLSFYINRKKYTTTCIIMVIAIALCMPLTGILFILILAFQSQDEEKMNMLDKNNPIPKVITSVSLPANQNHQIKIIQEKINLQSFIDILHSKGNETLKIKFINLLYGDISQNSIKLIKQATRDESSEVKIIAVSTLKKIEKPLLETIQKWYKIIKLNSSDEHAYFNLGVSCLEYCQLGIPDELNTANYLKQSEKAFMHVLSINPERTDTYFKLSEIYLATGEYNRALDTINKCLFFSPKDYQGTMLKCEILFQQKKFKQLKDYVKQIDTTHRDKLQSLKTVWTQ